MSWKKFTFTAALATAAVLLIPASVSANEDISRAALLSYNCYTCHGMEGKSMSMMPALNKLTSEELKKKLLDFKAGKSDATVMTRHAKGYSDEDIQMIADYIAGKNKKKK